MKRASVTLHDQIDIVEKRVRFEKLQLTSAIQGLRTSVRNIVFGPGDGVAIFLAAAVAGSSVGGSSARVAVPIDEPTVAKRRRAHVRPCRRPRRILPESCQPCCKQEVASSTPVCR
jgi:hypothetical protein